MADVGAELPDWKTGCGAINVELAVLEQLKIRFDDTGMKSRRNETGSAEDEIEAMYDRVSSACPDDIDPANGWNPTDIHVRVYPAKNEFSTAVAFRMTPDAEPQLTKETAFHSRTSKLTGNFIEYNGYWLANRFNNHGPIDEY